MGLRGDFSVGVVGGEGNVPDFVAGTTTDLAAGGLGPFGGGIGHNDKSGWQGNLNVGMGGGVSGGQGGSEPLWIDYW